MVRVAINKGKNDSVVCDRLSEKQLEKLVGDLFEIKGISFESFEIYIWNVTTNEKQVVKTLQAFEKLDDFDAMFCFSKVKTSINGTPFKFDQLDFSCSCVKGQCCNLYLDPDIFSFNSEEEIGVDVSKK